MMPLLVIAGRIHRLVLGCLLVSICGMAAATDVAASVLSWYTIQTGQRSAIARLITTAAQCPTLVVDGLPRAMHQRTAAETMPERLSGQQTARKPAAFPVTSCELPLPAGTRRATLDGHAFPLAPARIARMIVIGDTGCRAKQSDNAFQACDDADAWPFAQIAARAAAWQPDLVIHLGDVHYRESPCPASMAGCTNSPWGYGWDTWRADFFDPARPLLQAAPWVFVRGNHESCARAGQGWFRFLDAEPWTAVRSCNDPANDSAGDFSAPRAVALTPETQLIVFDSAKAAGVAYAPTQTDFQTYQAQFRLVDDLVQQTAHNFFLSHHPVLALAPGRAGQPPKPGNPALQSVMHAVHPGRLFAPGIDLAMHGHEHVFEALSFASDHPATYGLGNSGTMGEGQLPTTLPNGVAPAPGAVIADFVTRDGVGFATLEETSAGWRMTEYSLQGQAVVTCLLVGSKSTCTRVAQE